MSDGSPNPRSAISIFRTMSPSVVLWCDRCKGWWASDGPMPAGHRVVSVWRREGHEPGSKGWHLAGDANLLQAAMVVDLECDGEGD